MQPAIAARTPLSSSGELLIGSRTFRTPRSTLQSDLLWYSNFWCIQKKICNLRILEHLQTHWILCLCKSLIDTLKYHSLFHSLLWTRVPGSVKLLYRQRSYPQYAVPLIVLYMFEWYFIYYFINVLVRSSSFQPLSISFTNAYLYARTRTPRKDFVWYILLYFIYILIVDEEICLWMPSVRNEPCDGMRSFNI